MAEILFNKTGIARAGQCKGWNVVIEKEHDEYGDEYYVYLQNPKTNEIFDDYYDNFELLEKAVEEMDVEWIVSEERQKENKVMAWWIKKLPQSQKVFDMMTDGCDPTEAVGIYVLIGSLVLDFYDKPLKNHNSEELKKFLELYDQFIQEFKGMFLENNGKKLEKNPKAQDSIIAMVSTEMGEGTDSEDYDYVLNLMPEGMLKEEFKNFVNWAKNNNN